MSYNKPIMLAIGLLLIVGVATTQAVVNDRFKSRSNDYNASLVQMEQARRNFQIIKKIPHDNEPNLLIMSKQPQRGQEIIVKYSQNTADNLPYRLANGKGIENLHLSASLDQLGQKYKIKHIEPIFKNFKEKKLRLQKLLATDKKQLTLAEQKIRSRLERTGRKMQIPDLDRIYKLTLQLEHGQKLKDVVRAYSQNPDVEYAQLNHRMTINNVPDDADYPIQWALNNTGQQYLPGKTGTPNCDINAPQAWDISTGQDSVIVAVVDTGVDYNHRDIAANMWINQSERNGEPNVDDDGNGYIDDVYGYDFANSDPCQSIVDSDPLDDNGHGTHCAGIIAAKGNNSTDIVGVNWQARIMAAKFLDASGYGSDYTAIKAIKYCADNGADVLSCSWGPTERWPSDPALEDAIGYAYALGCITVFAAGNSNDDVAYYSPANYDKTIAVVATDSSDHRASFSNYGQLACLAAPGVDILSLRANGTTLDTPYDDYTVFASGTSMACPYVAGACALMLSVDPTLKFEDVRTMLCDTVDVIFNPADKICASNGRLNLYRAVLTAGPSHGFLRLDRNVYTCTDTVTISLRDADLQGQGSCNVTMEATSGDQETVALSETSRMGWFEGAIQCETQNVVVGDGKLQVVHGDAVTVTYYDANDGTGSAVIATAKANVDCAGPVISNLQNETGGSYLYISFATDEPATAAVRCGLVCGGPYDIIKTNSSLLTDHAFQLSLTEPNTDYYFIIETTDALGHLTVHDNNSQCYHFVSPPDHSDINVPGQYSTIQMAIDSAWNGDTIWIADGVYTDQGNHDIDFKGKSITVKGRNGAANCIIDCQHLGRGFLFFHGEDGNSILDGVTIINGYPDITKNPNPLTEADRDRGAGIYCLDSSPVIKNCRISGCMTAGGVGGGVFSSGGHLTVKNCEITDNSGAIEGGGIAAVGDLTVIDSTLARNICGYAGGAIFAFGGAIEISGSTIIDNKNMAGDFYDYGAGISCGETDTEVRVTRCIISRNQFTRASANTYGGGGYFWDCPLVLENCVITNSQATFGGGVLHEGGTNTVMNCTFTQNSSTYHGSFNCNGGGAIYNSIFWDNSSYEGYQVPGGMTISHCDIQGGRRHGVEGPPLDWIKNIDVDPHFAFTDDFHLTNGSRCINAGAKDPNGLLPSTDIDGNTRSLDGRSCIGAYEFSHSSPSIAVSPSLIVVNALQNGDPPDTQTLSIRNCGGGTLRWTIDKDCNWLDVDKTFGSSNGKVNTVTVSINQTGLPGGYHEAKLTVADSLAVNTPRKVVVRMYVAGNLLVPSRYSTIKAAMFVARNGDVIMVADGHYTGNGNRDITFDGKAVTIKSENGPQHCIVDCAGSNDDPHRGFAFYLTNEDANSIIDGLTIKNGYANFDFLKFWPVMDGGAIYCENSHPVIQNCIIENNRVLGDGGGICVVWREGSTRSYINNCVVRNNVAEIDGGGIWINDYADLTNLLVYNNYCGNDGGGIYLGDTCNPFVNCTIVNNTANCSAGGLYIIGGAGEGGLQAKLINSIVWSNTAGDGSEVKLIDVTPQDGIDSILTVRYSDVEGGRSGIAVDAYAILNWDASNLNSNPALTDDCHLTNHSPCINAGDPNFVPSANETDIDGQPRVIGGRVDMGGDEFAY